MLLVTGLAAGVLVFLTLGAAAICFAVQRKRQYRLPRQPIAAEAEPKNSLHTAMEMSEVKGPSACSSEGPASTNKEWAQAEPVASNTNKETVSSRHPQVQAAAVRASIDQENICSGRQDDSGCGGSTG